VAKGDKCGATGEEEEEGTNPEEACKTIVSEAANGRSESKVKRGEVSNAGATSNAERDGKSKRVNGKGAGRPKTNS
jgi:hypothetical protein